MCYELRGEWVMLWVFFLFNNVVVVFCFMCDMRNRGVVGLFGWGWGGCEKGRGGIGGICCLYCLGEWESIKGGNKKK